MIRHIVNSLYHRYNRCPRVGQWFATSNGHVLRVCLVNAESQKVVCELQGRSYTISYPDSAPDYVACFDVGFFRR